MTEYVKETEREYLKKHLDQYGFTQQQLDKIAEKSKTVDMCYAIAFARNCHYCGNKLSATNYEFCDTVCENTIKQFNCIWERECECCMKTQTQEKCDCYVCCIDGDKPVNLYNRAHGTQYDQFEYDVFVEYAEKMGIDLDAAIEYSKLCHNCGVSLQHTWKFGQEYCDAECESMVALCDKECQHQSCKICV